MLLNINMDHAFRWSFQPKSYHKGDCGFYYFYFKKQITESQHGDGSEFFICFLPGDCNLGSLQKSYRQT